MKRQRGEEENVEQRTNEAGAGNWRSECIRKGEFCWLLISRHQFSAWMISRIWMFSIEIRFEIFFCSDLSRYLDIFIESKITRSIITSPYHKLSVESRLRWKELITLTSPSRCNDHPLFSTNRRTGIHKSKRIDNIIVIHCGDDVNRLGSSIDLIAVVVIRSLQESNCEIQKTLEWNQNVTPRHIVLIIYSLWMSMSIRSHTLRLIPESFNFPWTIRWTTRWMDNSS